MSRSLYYDSKIPGYVPHVELYGIQLENNLSEKDLIYYASETGCYKFVELIAEATKDPRCKWTYISIRQGMTDDTLECLCDALYDNHTVTILDFRYNYITDVGYEHIARLCKVNNTIKEIRMSDSYISMSANCISKIRNEILQNIDIAIFCDIR